jgi:hypothetical protein
MIGLALIMERELEVHVSLLGMEAITWIMLHPLFFLSNKIHTWSQLELGSISERSIE